MDHIITVIHFNKRDNQKLKHGGKELWLIQFFTTMVKLYVILFVIIEYNFKITWDKFCDKLKKFKYFVKKE